ncbi:unnamed protein product [Cyprideis torosa]|uniref:Uncharacterized protein n=1 Tax=Cyprideis torosa TaxID=163714 RepID=A0A7R8ZNA7_9CRUS|nr:unnamed protein product [Cyprideis torosa]CAG0885932.1 unnamed protein product [Cyprideis torosa]
MGSLASPTEDAPRGGAGDANICPVVYVTGYGPFRNHVLNASWEAVSLLPNMNLERKLGIKLIVEQIPVQYDFVDREIPQRWKKLNPILVVHVGVSRAANELTLECAASNSSYCAPDITEKLPEAGMCCENSEADTVQTGLDLMEVSKVCMEQGFVAGVSRDAGRYLCEYVYRKSLERDRKRCVFIHVPDFNVLSSKETARRLSVCIELILKQLRKEDKGYEAVTCNAESGGGDTRIE